MLHKSVCLHNWSVLKMYPFCIFTYLLPALIYVSITFIFLTWVARSSGKTSPNWIVCHLHSMPLTVQCGYTRSEDSICVNKLTWLRFIRRPACCAKLNLVNKEWFRWSTFQRTHGQRPTLAFVSFPESHSFDWPVKHEHLLWTTEQLLIL